MSHDHNKNVTFENLADLLPPKLQKLNLVMKIVKAALLWTNQTNFLIYLCFLTVFALRFYFCPTFKGTSSRNKSLSYTHIPHTFHTHEFTKKSAFT